MEGLGASAALVFTHLPNVFYLCGFTGSNAALLLLPDSLHLFTDSRYTIQAREEAPGARVHIGRGPVAEAGGAYPARPKRAGDESRRLGNRRTSALQESLALKAGRGHQDALETGMRLVEASSRGQRPGRARRHAPCGQAWLRGHDRGHRPHSPRRERTGPGGRNRLSHAANGRLRALV